MLERSDRFREGQGCRQLHGGLYTLSVAKISAIVVSFPSVERQREIVAEVERRLSLVERLETEIDTQLHRAARLRRAILKRAFEGKLVPQDPIDEPASALLDRIRAARETEPKLSGTSKKPSPQTDPRALISPAGLAFYSS